MNFMLRYIVVAPAVVVAMTVARVLIAAATQEAGVENALLQWIVQQVGLGGLAAFALLMLNKVWRERLADKEEHIKEIGQQRSDLVRTFQENTKVLTQLCERLENIRK
jgi:hypothetical protein